MDQRITHLFRALFLCGLIMLFLSLFLEWYSFQVYTFENDLIVSWSYYIFSAWYTPFSSSSSLNSYMEPENATVPIAVNIILIIVLIVAGYVILMKNVDKADIIKNYNKYAYILIFTILLTGFYTIIAPIMYLAPNELYYPLLTVRDYDLEYVYVYSIGIGYILQVISFPLIFPYSVFYYKTVSSFIQEERSSEKILSQVIQKSQEPVDLDKYIAEEELEDKQVPVVSIKEDVNPIFTKFMEGKK